MKKGNHLKTLLYTLVAVLLLTAAMNPITLPVEEVLQGVALSLSAPAQAKSVTLSLKGNYGWKIFGGDQFDFVLQGAGLPESGVTLHSVDGVSLNAISSAQVDYIPYGDLCFTPFEKRKDLILLCAPQNGAAADTYLVFPAADRASALALLQQYDKESYTRFTAAD